CRPLSVDKHGIRKLGGQRGFANPLRTVEYDFLRFLDLTADDFKHQNSPAFHVGPASISPSGFGCWSVTPSSPATYPSSMMMLHSSPVLTRVAIACSPSCSSHWPNSRNVSMSICSSLSMSTNPH